MNNFGLFNTKEAISKRIRMDRFTHKVARFPLLTFMLLKERALGCLAIRGIIS
jgi:hypothetical protein